MADRKLSASSALTSLDAADLLLALDVSDTTDGAGGTTKKITKANAQTDLVNNGAVLSAIGYTPEDVANKDTDGTLAANSDTKYASQKAVKTYADTKQPLDSDLTSWAAITRAAGFDTFVATPSGANLASLLTSALPDSKGGTGLTSLSANVVSVLSAADYAAIRTLLGLVIGTNVQAWDADLDTWATKTAPSGTAVGTSDTQTLTNKRITPRVTSITSSATPTINTDNCDAVTITALATAITSMTTNLSGTPNNFDKLTFRIKDDGTARAITWGASFEAKGVALPTTTVISKVLTVGFIYDSVTSKWGCVASVQEA